MATSRLTRPHFRWRPDKGRTGTLTLTTSNAYGGSVSVNNGMLALSNTHRIYGNLDVAAGATADLSQASGVYLNDLTGDSGSTLELGTGALMIAEVLNRILAGTIEDGGNGAGILQKRGNRSLRLSGHNTCSGGTQIQVGLVDLAYADSAGTGEIDFIGSGSLTVE